MLLHSPAMISARLLPAVKIGEDTISVELSGYHGGRSVFTIYIDFADGTEYTCNDLSSPRESLQEALSSYLSFLSACGEAYGYHVRTGNVTDNLELFPTNVAAWCYQNADELSMMQMELEEQKLIED